MSFCEHCGPVRGKVYQDEGTSWCPACWRANGHAICLEHPRYEGKKPPKLACHDCWFAYFNKKGREYFGW